MGHFLDAAEVRGKYDASAWIEWRAEDGNGARPKAQRAEARSTNMPRYLVERAFPETLRIPPNDEGAHTCRYGVCGAGGPACIDPLGCR